MRLHLQKGIAISVALAVLHTSIWAAQVPQASDHDRIIEQQVQKVAPGSRTEVRLTDGSRLKGKLGAPSGGAFELQVTDGGPKGPRRIAFADVQSVRKAGMGTGKKIAIGLGIFGVMAALVAGLTIRAIARNG